MNNLKKLRDEAGLSLRTLGNMTGLAYSNLCKLERGFYTLRQETMESLSAFYNVDMDYLLGKEPGRIFCQYYPSAVEGGFFPVNLPGDRYRQIANDGAIELEIEEDGDHPIIIRKIKGKWADIIHEDFISGGGTLAVDRRQKLLDDLYRLTDDQIAVVESMVKSLLDSRVSK